MTERQLIRILRAAIRRYEDQIMELEDALKRVQECAVLLLQANREGKPPSVRVLERAARIEIELADLARVEEQDQW